MLGDCLALLETAPAGGAEGLREALRAAADRGREDASAGAAGWLEHGAATERPALARPREAEELAERLDHLGRLSRVILGR